MRPLSAAALGKSHTDPVGRPVGGAAEAAALDECFEQVDGMAVLGRPVPRNAPGDRAQNVTGQLRNPDPRQDEEAGIVGDAAQREGTLGGTPTDPPVPGRKAKGSGFVVCG